jgi:hypothetical protein
MAHERNIAILPIDNDIREECLEAWKGSSHVLLCAYGKHIAYVASSGLIAKHGKPIFDINSTFEAKHDQTGRRYKETFAVRDAYDITSAVVLQLMTKDKKVPLYTLK